MNRNTLICLDFETSSADPYTTHPLQIAAKAYHPVTLQPIENGEFSSYMNVPPDCDIQEGALKVNKINRADIPTFPSPDRVWNSFIDWVQRFNVKKSKWDAPIAMGYNIRGFDLPIVARMNQLYSPKKEETILFNKIKAIDLMDIIFQFFEGNNELENFKLDTVRDYMGISKENSHNAITDVSHTGKLIMRFLEWFRKVAPPGKFKGAFA